MTPPRPLPGLERYPVDGSLPVQFLILALIVGAIMALAWRLFRRKSAGLAMAEVSSTSPEVEIGPAEVLVASVRSALITRFGPGWSSRTTEEIAASDELVTILGDDATRRLADWLAQLDRVRFAPARGELDRADIPPGPPMSEILDRLKTFDRNGHKPGR